MSSAIPVAVGSSKAALVDAITRVNAGRIGEAMERCRDAVQANPNDVNMTALLGAILLKSRELELAEKYLRRAVELAPDFAKPQEDLGFLRSESGRFEEAVPLLQNATRLEPNSERGFMTLGCALSGLGKGAEADAAFESAFDLNPIRKKLAFAAEHHKAGRLEDAEKYRLSPLHATRSAAWESETASRSARTTVDPHISGVRAGRGPAPTSDLGVLGLHTN